LRTCLLLRDTLGSRETNRSMLGTTRGSVMPASLRLCPLISPPPCAHIVGGAFRVSPSCPSSSSKVTANSRHVSDVNFEVVVELSDSRLSLMSQLQCFRTSLHATQAAHAVIIFRLTSGERERERANNSRFSVFFSVERISLTGKPGKFPLYT
jgi:hypothetical protein